MTPLVSILIYTGMGDAGTVFVTRCQSFAFVEVMKRACWFFRSY